MAGLRPRKIQCFLGRPRQARKRLLIMLTRDLRKKDPPIRFWANDCCAHSLVHSSHNTFRPEKAWCRERGGDLARCPSGSVLRAKHSMGSKCGENPRARAGPPRIPSTVNPRHHSYAGTPARPSLAGGGPVGVASGSDGRRSPRKRPRKAEPAGIVSAPPVVVVGQRRRRLAAGLAAVAASWLHRSAEGQYIADTPLFEETMERAEAELTASLKGGDYVEDVFFPDRQVGTKSDQRRRC